jgi:hypothetical protein
VSNKGKAVNSDFDSIMNNDNENNNSENENTFDSIRKQILYSGEVITSNENNIEDDETDEEDNGENLAIIALDNTDDEKSQNREHSKSSDGCEAFDGEEEIWRYRMGNAYNETQREYEILRTFMEMGRSRSSVHLLRIFNLTNNYYKKLREKNNWVERLDSYDRTTYLNALSEETVAREEEHRRKLEFYRAQQETLANQASSASAKMLHLINRKLNKIVEDVENLTIDEMVSVGNLSTKLIQLQKDIGAQALGVDALLEAIEEDNGQ